MEGSINKYSFIYHAIHVLLNNDEDDFNLFSRYLMQKYNSKSYHNLNHIEQVFINIDYNLKQLKSMGIDVNKYELKNETPISIEFKTFLAAIIFHDIFIGYDDEDEGSDVRVSTQEAIKVCKWFNIEVDEILLSDILQSTCHPCTNKSNISI